MKKITPVSIRIYRLIAAFLVVGAMTGAISLYALSRLGYTRRRLRLA
jgi:hypothetical protein